MPVWLVVVAAILALIGLVDRLLMPSVRWFFRGRVNRAIEKLNTSLSLKIQPFKLTKRQALIDALMFDTQVIKAVEAEADETGRPREVVMETARAYAREVVPAFSHYTYFKVGTTLARRLSQMLYRVRLGNSNDEALAEVDPGSTVVFVMNHRSNMDYVLVTYMAATSSALSYAVGEWARIWALQNLIRSMGAYFVRRQSSGNALYRKVLARYVHMATTAGVTQAIFPEGGLSGDGKLRAPKFGLLSYMVSDFEPDGDRDIVFIPVGLNYDRVLEDRLLTSAHGERTGGGTAGGGAAGGGAAGAPGEGERKKPKFRFSFGVFCAFLGRSFLLALKGNWFRYGYACVSFGKPLSMRDYLDQNQLNFRAMGEPQRFEEIENLGQRLMEHVGAAVPVLPTSLVARVLVEAGAQTLSLFELKSRVFNLIKLLVDKGAYVHIPRADHDYLVDVGLRMLTLRHLVVEEKPGNYAINPEEKTLVAYYANAIAHLLPSGP